MAGDACVEELQRDDSNSEEARGGPTETDLATYKVRAKSIECESAPTEEVIDIVDAKEVSERPILRSPECGGHERRVESSSDIRGPVDLQELRLESLVEKPMSLIEDQSHPSDAVAPRGAHRPPRADERVAHPPQRQSAEGDGGNEYFEPGDFWLRAWVIQPGPSAAVVRWGDPGARLQIVLAVVHGLHHAPDRCGTPLQCAVGLYHSSSRTPRQIADGIDGPLVTMGLSSARRRVRRATPLLHVGGKNALGSGCARDRRVALSWTLARAP